MDQTVRDVDINGAVQRAHEAVDKLTTKWLTNGEKHERLEAAFAAIDAIRAPRPIAYNEEAEKSRPDPAEPVSEDVFLAEVEETLNDALNSLQRMHEWRDAKSDRASYEVYDRHLKAVETAIAHLASLARRGGEV